MNILFISAILPYPLFSGGQVRMFNLLKRLSEKHTITLCSFIRTLEEKDFIKNINFCNNVHLIYRGRAMQPSYIIKSIIGKYPLVMSSYDLPEMKQLIADELKINKYDLIHLEPGYIWPALPETSLPIIVGEHNIEHRVYEEYVNHYNYPIIKQIMRRDVEKLKQWESTIWKKAEFVITVSSEDADEVLKIKKSNVGIVPNGIDPDVFTFKPKEKVSKEFTALFIGNFRWIQNLDAVKHLLKNIWPTLIESFPEAKLRIVGKDFPEKYLSLLTDSVSVIHHVELITDEFNKADIVLAPIRVGGGTKYKILEAMAAGVPVITSLKGTQGLPLVDGENCFIGESGFDTIKILKKIIDNPEGTKKVIKNARLLVEKEYSWNSIAKEMSDIWSTYAKN